MSYNRPDTTTITVHSHNPEDYLVVLGVLHEAGVDTTPVGGNAIVVPTDALGGLDAEQRAEVAKLADLPPAGDDPSTPPGDGGAPPRSGAGSGRDAWAAYAAAQGVQVDDDMSRDQIIEAVEAQR